MSSPFPHQPIKGPRVFCPSCHREDFLWFCKDRVPSDNGTGQYLWKWTTCCNTFMKLDGGMPER